MASVGPVGSAPKCCLYNFRMPGVQLEGRHQRVVMGRTENGASERLRGETQGQRQASGGLSEDGVKEKGQVCVACILGS